jgi:hypothetical protein
VNTNFSEADADALFSAIRSYAKQLGLSGVVIGHDPENAPPPAGISCSVMLGPVKPILSSGLDAVSGEITLVVHIWNFAQKRPLDDIDPSVLAAACQMIGKLAGGFTLGGTVRDVNLFAITTAPGYVNFQEKQFRTMQINVPIEINDMWTEAA